MSYFKGGVIFILPMDEVKTGKSEQIVWEKSKLKPRYAPWHVWLLLVAMKY